MSKKKIRLLVIFIVVIAIVIAFIAIRKNRIKSAVRPVVESWVEKNSIQIDSFSASQQRDGDYAITIYWNGFEKLTPSEMWRIMYSFYNWDTRQYELDSVISNGRKYALGMGMDSVYSYAENKHIYVHQRSSYSNSGSSSSSKTATCNYCNGSGKVNGDKCPWCNGSGKTYDNYFNDQLGKTGH